jgi:hypothetical protein
MATSTFKPTKDNRILASAATLNTGIATVYQVQPGATSRVLMGFDLAVPDTGDAIPAGATITSVSMFFRGTSAGQGDGGAAAPAPWTATFQRLSRTNWTEGENVAEDPADDGSTWNQFDSSLVSPAGDWTTPGGDVTGKTWTFSVASGAGDKNITDADFIEIVQGGLDDHAGLVSLSLTRETAGTGQALATKDNATAAFHPVMTVEWELPAGGDSAAGVGRVRDRSRGRAA